MQIEIITKVRLCKLEIRNTTGKTNQKKKAVVTPTKVVCCAGCGEPENESTEPWIGCCICKTWYEVSCAGMAGKPRDIQDVFVCSDCQ